MALYLGFPEETWKGFENSCNLVLRDKIKQNTVTKMVMDDQIVMYAALSGVPLVALRAYVTLSVKWNMDFRDKIAKDLDNYNKYIKPHVELL